MLQDSLNQSHAGPLPVVEAPWARVAVEPPGPWVEDEPYESSAAPAKDGLHVTHLCWARQVDAGTGRSFHVTATRLETTLAVQHESQWSLELDARTQRVTLHWLRIVRGGERIDHLRPGRMRLLQRETQLERLVLDGRWTLLVVLDDVRVGDVVEAAYTYETQDPIRPGACEAFFMVPPQTVVARYRLSVNFTTGAEPRWQSSPDTPERREETLADGRRRWSWSGAQAEPREPEPNAPGNWLGHVWVQVSDLTGWPALATRVAAKWSEVADAEALVDLPAFTRPERVDADAILGLVTHLQEEFRYLSLDLQAGGWVPSTPSAVARRRHGDCKDFAWLATVVLRGWGVKARPILVGTGFRAKVAELLPMAGLFNHAILEVEWDGRRRWFDLTEHGQGGDFVTRAVAWFGHGLPVDEADNALQAQPGERAPGSYALRETILIDTTREGSALIEQRVRATGWHADQLRRARVAQGAETFFKDLESSAQRRLGRARRAGEPLWREDRTLNVCEIVEVYEIREATHLDERGDRAIYDVPAGLPALWFSLPEDKPRHAPWDMPFPCEVSHVIVIKAAGMGTGTGRRRRWEEPEFEAALDDMRLNGQWTRTYRFNVLTPEITAARVPAYRKQFEGFLRESGWRLYLPTGRVRPHRGKAFGEFVEPLIPERRPEPRSRPAPAAAPTVIAATATISTAPAAAAQDLKYGRGETPRSGRRTSRRSSRGKGSSGLRWAVSLGVALLVALFGLIARGCPVGGP
jgi:hypothetical protein